MALWGLIMMNRLHSVWFLVVLLLIGAPPAYASPQDSPPLDDPKVILQPPAPERLVPRNDPERRHRRRTALQTSLILIGSASMIGGSVAVVGTVFGLNRYGYGCAQYAANGTCDLFGVTDRSTAAYVSGGVFIGLGMAALLAGLFIDPLEPNEPRSPQATTLRLAPHWAPEGGGIALSGTF